LITSVVPVSLIAIALIITVGILFITDDSIAAIAPIPITVAKRPYSVISTIRSAKTSVRPAFLKPKTTTYIPIENTTMFHGAPLTTLDTLTTSDLLARSRNIIAINP